MNMKIFKNYSTAKQANLIDKLKPHLEALQQGGIYIRQELIDAVLREVGEMT